MDRNARNAIPINAARIGRQAKAVPEAVEFFNILTSPELLATTEALLPEHRERLYPPTVDAVDVHAPDDGGRWLVPEGGQRLGGAACGRWLEPCSVRTGAYCRARQRLPLEMVSTLTRASGRIAEPPGTGALAVARPCRQAGGRHGPVDARHP
jgi:hypothetical protein